MTLKFRELDLTNGAEVHAFLDFDTQQCRELRPDYQPRSIDDFIAAASSTRPGQEDQRWLAFLDGELVGSCQVWGAVEGEPDADKRGLCVEIAHQHRRCGYGREFLAFIENQIPPRCKVLLAEIEWAPGSTRELSSSGFALSTGYEQVSAGKVRQLFWPVDPAKVVVREPLPEGYTLASYVDGIPEHYRESFGRLYGMVNVDAPSGTVEWQADVLSPQRYLQRVEHARARRCRLLETIAIYDQLLETIAIYDQKVVALTALDIPHDPQRRMNVDVTYVDPAHRGRRLGLAAKTALEHQLLQLGVTNPSIHTYNDDENHAMIAINEQLGFTVDKVCQVYRKER
ncbi:MAG: GNAT family N-acetyltransferase [Propionibacteriaceae bacterium]